MAVAMQGADQHIRGNLGFSILPKDTSTCIPGELNQQPSDNKTVALPPEPQQPMFHIFYKILFVATGRLLPQWLIGVSITKQIGDFGVVVHLVLQCISLCLQAS